jgi:hypothetical protein
MMFEKSFAADGVHLEHSHRARASYCEQLLVGWLLTQRAARDRLPPGAAPRFELSDDTESELRGLGYVDLCSI